MSDLKLGVGILAGTHIEDAVAEMADLSKRLGLVVTSKHNGREVTVHTNGSFYIEPWPESRPTDQGTEKQEKA